MADKSRERHFLECFIRSAGIEVLSIVEHERPDFLITLPDGEVGVEVTELLKPVHAASVPERTQEAVADQVIQKARLLYEQRSGPAVHVSVLFNPGHDLRKVQRDQLASAIARFVEDNPVASGQRVEWHPDGIEDQLPDVVSYVQVLGVPGPEYVHWKVPKAGWVACLTDSALAERIAAKAAKLPEYQTSVRRVWLLIVADRTRTSQMFEHQGAFEPSELKHPFERAYYYPYPENSILVLGGAA